MKGSGEGRRGDEGRGVGKRVMEWVEERVMKVEEKG